VVPYDVWQATLPAGVTSYYFELTDGSDTTISAPAA